MITTDPLPWRGCQICRHGLDVGGERHCANPEATRPHATQPVELMRRNAGPCGPEAYLLDFPGLTTGRLPVRLPAIRAGAAS